MTLKARLSICLCIKEMIIYYFEVLLSEFLHKPYFLAVPNQLQLTRYDELWLRPQPYSTTTNQHNRTFSGSDSVSIFYMCEKREICILFKKSHLTL